MLAPVTLTAEEHEDIDVATGSVLPQDLPAMLKLARSLPIDNRVRLLTGESVWKLHGIPAIATVVAVLVGVTAGYVAGVKGEALSALMNVFLVIPGCHSLSSFPRSSRT